MFARRPTALLAVAIECVNCYRTPMTPPSPPLPSRPASERSLFARNHIARIHAGWTRALLVNDRKAAADWAFRAAGMTAVDEVAAEQLSGMALWRIELSLRQGEAELAASELAAFEAVKGPTHKSRLLKARLLYFRAAFEAAAAACGEAIMLLPLAKSPGNEYGAIIRFQADCLCLAGRPDDARRLLERAFAHKSVWTTEDIKALRQTVVDETGLDDFQAFLAPYFSYPGIRSRAALYHYSMACRDLGLYARAELAIRQRFLSATRLETFGARPPTIGSKPDWVEDARQTLRDLRSVASSVGAEMFLISGTLLGAVREGDILGHDKDVDVGIMETADLDKEKIEAAFRYSGRFSVKPYQVPTLLRVQHASGVMVDVFWHRHEDGLVIHEGMKTKWWNAPFALSDFRFLGDTHKIPSSYGRYLGENYGEWERPNAEFETFVDTPNMIVTNEGEIVWYYYCKLFDYYLQGKLPQFSKVATALAQLRPNDQAVRSIVNDVLKSETNSSGDRTHDDALDNIGFENERALGDSAEPLHDAAIVTEAVEADALEADRASLDA